MTNVSSKADIRTWANNTLDVDDAQAERIADAIWKRGDFPHPVNNTNLDDYLETLDDGWLTAMSFGPEE